MRRISLLLVLMFVISNVPIHMGDAQGSNRAPTAEAGPNLVGPAGTNFIFNGSGSTDPDNDILDYSWDFDASDGIQSDSADVIANHTYTEIGNYTVTLTVSDGQATSTDTCFVNVLDPSVNHRPVAIIDTPSDHALLNMTGKTFFDGRSSYDPDRENITWLWDMGDNNHTFTQSHFYFKMPTYGVFTIVLKVGDGRLEDSTSITVLVYPPAPGIPMPQPDKWTQERPAILSSGPYEGPENMGTWMNAFGFDKDGGNTTLSWDFDSSDGVNIFAPEAINGTVIWPYNASGSYTVTIIAETQINVGIGTNPNVGKLYNFTQTVANITEHCRAPIKLVDRMDVDRPMDATKVQVSLNPVATVCQPSNDGEISLYEWDFNGDGTYDWSSPNTGSVTHNYEINASQKGEVHYNASLRVTQRNSGYIQTNLPGTPKGASSFKYNITSNKSIDIAIGAPPNIVPTCSILDKERLSDVGGFVGEPVKFRAEGTDQDGTIVRFQWDFGDGTSMIGKEVDHTYDRPFDSGVSVELTCYDDRNGTDSDDTQVIVRQNGIPVAVISGQTQANVGEAAQFDGTESIDPDGDPLTYMWDFDDSDGVGVDSTDPNPTYSYTKGGIYVVTLKVRDNHKGESEAVTTIIDVVQSYGFTAEVTPAKGKGRPGETIMYHILLMNTGNGDDTFSLDATGSKDSWAVLSVTQVDIDADKTADITVNVHIPDSESAATFQIPVDIISKGDSTQKESVQLSVQVQEVFGLELVASVTTLSVKAGEAGALSATVTNTGNADDTIKLEVSGDGSDYVKLASTNPKVGKGQKTEVKITVTVPKDTEGKDYQVTLKATSGGGGTSKSVTMTISVTGASKGNKVPGFDGALMALAVVSITLLLAAARKPRRY